MGHLESYGKVTRSSASIVSHEWSLENFKNIDTATGSFVISPAIPTHHPEIKWRMALYPNGLNEEDKDYLGICIQLFSSMETISITELLALVRIHILNSEDYFVNVHNKECRLKLLPETEYHNVLLPDAMSCDRSATRQYVIDENNKILSNGCLRVCCEIIFYDSVFDPYEDNANRNNHRLKEFDDFKKLLADDKFSDFTFALGNKEIRVHKAILASRSPVFEAMFTNEMQEKKQNRADISDIQYPVLKELLQFVYTGTVNESTDTASDLLIAADKYCVAGLKTSCEKALSDDLNVDNVLERLVLADTYNSILLRENAIEFIVNNPSRIVSKQEFATLRSDIMCEITRGLNKRLAALAK